jgi:predicted MFS family arabinose efflux permease
MLNNKKVILPYIFFQLLILHIVQFVIGPLIPLISEDLGVGLDIIGIVISMGVLGLFVSAFLSGNIIDIYGFKNILYISLVFSFACSLGIYFSAGHISFIIFYLILQFASGIIIGCTISLTGYISPDNRGRNLIIVMIGGASANLVSPLIVTFSLLRNTGWRVIFLFIAVFLLILSIILFFIKIPRPPRQQKGIWQIIRSDKKILLNGLIITYSILMFFNIAVIFTFYTWFTLYFSSFGISISRSSLYLSLFGLALVLGSVIKIQILKIKAEADLLFYSLIISLASILAINFSKALVMSVILVFLFGLSISSNGMIIISMGVKVFKKYNKNVAGFLMAASYLGVMFFQYLTGYLSENYTSGSVIYINVCLVLLSLIIVIFIKTLIKRSGRS